MKRTRMLSILLAVLLVFSCSAAVLAAEPMTVTVETKADAVSVGEEVSLTVSIAGNPGFTSYDWAVEYDTASLELKKVENKLSGYLLTREEEGRVNLGLMSAEPISENGTAFVVTFLVKEKAAAGLSEVKLSSKKLANLSQTLQAQYIAGGVTIAGSTGGSSTGGSSTGGSSTGGSSTGGSSTGGSSTGGSSTGKPVPIAIALRDAAVSVGETIQLEPVFTPADTTQRDVTWSSSNSNIATIDANGRVTGVAEGTATITVTSTAAPAITASCTVTVTKNLSDAGLAAIIAAIGNGSLPFNDVTVRDYFYDAVMWAVDRGITSGTSRYTFSPDAPCTRAQVVTFLWRAAGCPQPVSKVNPFTDVRADDYFYAAVLWAVENGITNGTSAKTFSPDATVTRAQVVTFLWRANGQPAAGPSGFVDVSSNAYYARAVDWAFENGITTGMGYGAFGPDTACTRAQIVTFLYRAR